MADTTSPADPTTVPAPVSVRTVIGRLRNRPRSPHRHGIVGNFLLGIAAVYSSYFAWWALCLLHGNNRVLAAGGGSVAYLLSSAMWRRGWFG